MVHRVAIALVAAMALFALALLLEPDFYGAASILVAVLLVVALLVVDRRGKAHRDEARRNHGS